MKLPPPVMTLALSTGTNSIACIKKIKMEVQCQMPLMYTSAPPEVHAGATRNSKL